MSHLQNAGKNRNAKINNSLGICGKVEASRKDNEA
jgi:hypothetical protein